MTAAMTAREKKRVIAAARKMLLTGLSKEQKKLVSAIWNRHQFTSENSE
jgi:hypothetical protein